MIIFIYGVIIGIIIGIIVCVAVAMLIEDHDWKQACIEAHLDKCCENAYQCGYELGRRKGWEECLKELF